MLKTILQKFGEVIKEKILYFTLLFSICFLLLSYSNLYAYIGPGAGFAFLTSFLVIFITILLASISIMIWPLRYLCKILRRKKNYRQGEFERIIIVGLDGMDYTLTYNYMNEGKLPNFENLMNKGSFLPLKTTYPSVSPVAWSSFMTGVNPGKHNIFDFLIRDTKTYLPSLSSVKIVKGSKSIKIGKWNIPLEKPVIKLLRKSKPFWNILGENGIFSTILRVPITFPPEKFNGLLLSGMCVPDLKGTQGTFTFYTSKKDENENYTGGVRIKVDLERDVINSFIYGPENSLSSTKDELKIPFKIKINRSKEEIEINILDEIISLKKGEFSKWIRFIFKTGLGVNIYGIGLFYLKEIEPNFELYLSPIHVDPENPAIPISHPFFYSIYLSKLLGIFSTLGLSEDTWALNEGILDDKVFLKQAYMIHEERKKIFFHSLKKTKKGLLSAVFDVTDRIQHMFFRYLDESHPAIIGKDKNIKKYKNVIEELYQKMDNMIGEVLERVNDEKTLLMIISDHGFKIFKRCVNLNSWLYLNGYLYLKNNSTSDEWFKDVNWEKTKAYAFGLSGIYINLKGRESKGIVNKGEEYENLKRELIHKLTGLKDDEKGQIAINKVYDTSSLYTGPYISNAPDMIVGYNVGYRTSWECAVGKVDNIVFRDNQKSWSGDHCIDPELVPGVFFCNRRIFSNSPRIIDISATVLKLFGITIPQYMEGTPLL